PVLFRTPVLLVRFPCRSPVGVPCSGPRTRAKLPRPRGQILTTTNCRATAPVAPQAKHLPDNSRPSLPRCAPKVQVKAARAVTLSTHSQAPGNRSLGLDRKSTRLNSSHVSI